ncbi:MAG TPA: hypothetical protein VHU85_17850 [Acidimicrobiales bacterium]|nr:hypothetical protein [Acidimicrobiales bacterium]
MKTIEMIDDVGAWWETKGVSRVSSDLSSVDPSSFDAVELISVKTTAHILEITPQAVTGLLARGSLQGQKRGREWFVDAASVKARKEVSA